MRVWCWVLLACLMGCDRPAPQSTDYDQTCSVAEDCVVVFNDPNSCNCSCGEFDAINVSELEAWTVAFDRFNRRQRCRSTCDLGCLYIEPDPVCDAGTCSTEPADTGTPP